MAASAWRFRLAALPIQMDSRRIASMRLSNAPGMVTTYSDLGMILVAAIMIGFPVAFTMMALGVAFGYYAYFQAGTDFFDNRVFYLLTQNTFTVLNNDALVSIRRAGADIVITYHAKDAAAWLQ